jgi:hypothetical protein
MEKTAEDEALTARLEVGALAAPTWDSTDQQQFLSQFLSNEMMESFLWWTAIFYAPPPLCSVIFSFSFFIDYPMESIKNAAPGSSAKRGEVDFRNGWH